jgi:pimeloyl-ACP methyl ester carboxylesterase
MSLSPTPVRTLVRAALVALIAVAALLVPASSTLAAPNPGRHGAPVQTHSHAPKPTVVLVHGAWADSSSWSGVITRLQRDNYNVLAAPNPLRSLSGDAAYLRDFLATVAGPIVLVGHSYGGAVITNAATGNPNVKALVYVDAFAPEQGETVNSLVGAGSALTADPATLFDIRPYPGAPAGDADVYLKASVFTDSFAQDLPRREATLLAAIQRPLTLAAGNEPSGVPAWRTIPSWYLLGTLDKIITPASQLAMAQRAHSHIVKVRASHVSLISHPSATAKIILAAAHTAT